MIRLSENEISSSSMKSSFREDEEIKEELNEDETPAFNKDLYR